MIIDEFTHAGYNIQLVDEYEIRVINPHGKRIKNPPKAARQTEKWKEFKNLRKQHRSDISSLKRQLTAMMFSRQEVKPMHMIFEHNPRTSTDITMGDVFSMVENMYVEATNIVYGDTSGDQYVTTFRGFVDGYNDKMLLVEGRGAESVRLLHPLEIENINDIHVRAIMEQRMTHIMQLFRPQYEPEGDEEFVVTRFLEVQMNPRKCIALTDSYSWKVRRTSHGPEEGTVVKIFHGKDHNYLVSWQYSLDFPRGKDTWEAGVMEFSIIYGEEVPGYKNDAPAPQPCRCFDVDPVVFTEAVWEIQKIVDVCRVDDEISKGTLEYRQNIARIYIRALGLDNCQILGSVVKIYGDWGIYGVSLKDGRSMWWNSKRYICIQPTSGHESPKYGAFLISDGVLDDPTVALAISKIKDLSDDTHPVDDVEGNQIRPQGTTHARDGMLLADVRKEKEEFMTIGGKIWN
jgi:hypothetical protein